MSKILDAIRAKGSPVSLSLLSSEVIAGKIVLVTGANTGLGLEAARHYAQLGAARIILGVRSQANGDAAKQNIEASLSSTTNQPQTAIDVWILDLASFDSVVSFSQRINNELGHLDMAVLNAAVAKREFVLTKDGWDESLQVNMLSTLLLGLLLLPKLKASSTVHQNWTPRLEFVASRAHQVVNDGEPWQSEASIMQALNKPNVLHGVQHYATSKLLLIYGVLEIVKLATDVGGNPSVIVNYTCPGPCKSDLTRDVEANMIGRLGVSIIHATICKTAEEGSGTLVFATCLGEESHGKWIHNDRIKE
jgi:retinol dehydrogenase-12